MSLCCHHIRGVMRDELHHQYLSFSSSSSSSSDSGRVLALE